MVPAALKQEALNAGFRFGHVLLDYGNFLLQGDQAEVFTRGLGSGGLPGPSDDTGSRQRSLDQPNESKRKREPQKQEGAPPPT